MWIQTQRYFISLGSIALAYFKNQAYGKMKHIISQSGRAHTAGDVAETS